MARLNVYLPDDLYELANRWRGSVNLSEVCANALREELGAADASRIPLNLSTLVKKRSSLEIQLLSRFQLADVAVSEAAPESQLRETLGVTAASYLDRNLCDGATLAVAGGRQIWSVVRGLSPRNLRLEITALGIEQNDPEALHTHPNTLLTLLWLLYAPRSKAHLVGSDKFSRLWKLPKRVYSTPRFFVLASCAQFSDRSPFAQLAGPVLTKTLLDQGAVADFAYVFFGKSGEVINGAIDGEKHSSVFTAEQMRNISSRGDARAILVAGGIEKIPPILWALENRLCNTLITDCDTAQRLLKS